MNIFDEKIIVQFLDGYGFAFLDENGDFQLEIEERNVLSTELNAGSINVQATINGFKVLDIFININLVLPNRVANWAIITGEIGKNGNFDRLEFAYRWAQNINKYAILAKRGLFEGIIIPRGPIPPKREPIAFAEIDVDKLGLSFDTEPYISLYSKAGVKGWTGAVNICGEEIYSQSVPNLYDYSDLMISLYSWYFVHKYYTNIGDNEVLGIYLNDSLAIAVSDNEENGEFPVRRLGNVPFFLLETSFTRPPFFTVERLNDIKDRDVYRLKRYYPENCHMESNADYYYGLDNIKKLILAKFIEFSEETGGIFGLSDNERNIIKNI